MMHLLTMFPLLTEELLVDITEKIGHVDYGGSVTQCKAGTSINGVSARDLGYIEGKKNVVFRSVSGNIEQFQFGSEQDGVWWREWKEAQITEQAVIEAIIKAGFTV